MNQRSLQKAESRGAILRTAASLLRERGIAGVSVERAMAGAGRTVGAFYAHFGSKDELLEHAFVLAMGDIGEMMREAADGQTPREAVVAIAQAYLSEEHRDKAARGCPLPALAAGAAAEPREGQSLISRGLSTMVDRISTVAKGELTKDQAFALAVILIGGQILARATRGSSLSSRVLASSLRTAHAIVAGRSGER